MANRIPSHTLASIVAAANEITDEYNLPVVPQELLAAIFRIQRDIKESTTDDDKFYIDETNMVERRFLKDATDTFEQDRDVDPFANAALYPNLLECTLAHPVLQPFIRNIATQSFLNGTSGSGRIDTTGEMLSLAPILRDETSFETGRTRYLKEHPDETLQGAVSILTDASSDDYSKISCLAFITGHPMVVEDETGSTRVIGPSPQTPSDTVYWMRGVVDGWLGISMTAEIAEERFQKSALTRYNPAQNGSPLLHNKKLRVNALREAYETVYGEKPKKLKKAELVKTLSEKCLWGVHLPTIVVVM